MKYKLNSAALAATLALASLGAQAHGDEERVAPRQHDASKVEPTAFGQEGNPKKVSRTVKVDMTDNMRFVPADLAVKRGETVKFVVHNSGQLLHEMVLGTKEALEEHAELMKKFPEMEHADPNRITLAPGATGEIVWRFSKAGKIDFACLQPGHYDAGMKGVVDVSAAKAAGR